MAAATAALFAGYLLGRHGSAPPAPGPPAAPASSSSAPANVVSAPAPSASIEPAPRDVHTRARAGELESMKLLEARPVKVRSIEDVLAVAAGHRALLARSVAELGRDLAREPALASDPSVLARLAEHTSDPEAAPFALAIVAELPGEVGPDLLYEVATQGDHSATQSIAEDLLQVPKVRDKASKALEATLDLETASRCEKVHQILFRVREHGDKRALPRLKELAKKTGCGRDRKEDCWPCLRGDDLIAGSREVLGRKKPPRPWAIRRR